MCITILITRRTILFALDQINTAESSSCTLSILSAAPNISANTITWIVLPSANEHAQYSHRKKFKMTVCISCGTGLISVAN